jgi:sarcosine oxidase subunit alpha
VSADVTIHLDGTPHRVPDGITLAAALGNLEHLAFRRDVGGGARAPLCGMGTCFECRLVVDGTAGVRSCLVEVRDGMQVESTR